MLHHLIKVKEGYIKGNIKKLKHIQVKVMNIGVLEIPLSLLKKDPEGKKERFLKAVIIWIRMITLVLF